MFEVNTKFYVVKNSIFLQSLKQNSRCSCIDDIMFYMEGEEVNKVLEKTLIKTMNIFFCFIESSLFQKYPYICIPAKLKRM